MLRNISGSSGSSQEKKVKPQNLGLNPSHETLKPSHGLNKPSSQKPESAKDIGEPRPQAEYLFNSVLSIVSPDRTFGDKSPQQKKQKILL